MKQIVVNIPDKKYTFFMKLVKSLGFVEQTEIVREPSKEQILQDIGEAVKEVKLIVAGKKKAKPLNDFLNEL